MVVRAKDAGVDAQGRVSDVGSGVVVSSDGKIMTAAHLVQGAEGIGVQFLGGRTVGARVVASELAADLSLIQLDQVPAGLQPAKLHRGHDRGRSGQDSRAHEPARQCGSGDGDGAAGGSAAEAQREDAVEVGH